MELEISGQPSTSSNDLDVDADGAAKNIGKLQKALDEFARSLASCYTNYDRRKIDPEVLQIRAEITKNAQLYRQVHLAGITVFLEGLSTVMKSYENNTEEQFAQDIEIIAGEAAKHERQALMVAHLHLMLLTDVNNLKEDVEASEQKLQLEAKKHNVRSEEAKQQVAFYQKRAESIKRRAKWVRFGCKLVALPTDGLSILAGMLLGYFYSWNVERELKKQDYPNAVVREAEKVSGKASSVEQMLTLVQIFAEAIYEASMFFNRLNNELQAFAQEAKSALSEKQKNSIHSRVLFHCRAMKKPAAKLANMCDEFLGYAPIIQAELKRICHKDNSTYESYIREWQDAHESEVRKALNETISRPGSC